MSMRLQYSNDSTEYGDLLLNEQHTAAELVDETTHSSSPMKEVADSSEETADEGSVPIEHNYYKRHNIKTSKRKSSVSLLPRNVPSLLVTQGSHHLCLQCGRQFSSIIAYLQHRRKHLKTKTYPYSCGYCPRKFRFTLQLDFHLMHHTKLEAFTCPVCQIQIFSALALVHHMEVHRMSNIYHRCTTCTVRFSSIEQLEAHTLSVHPLYNEANQNLPRTVHICFHCSKTESSWDELKVHMRCHKGALRCKECSTLLENSDKFAKHVSQIHKDLGELTYYRCTNRACSQEFLSTQQLKRHETSCLPSGGEFQCEICKQLYREVDHFISHMRLHEMLSGEVKNKRCSHCAFEGENASEYAGHMVHVHGYRDRMEAIEEAHGFKEVVNLDSLNDTGDSDCSEDNSFMAAIDNANGGNGGRGNGER